MLKWMHDYFSKHVIYLLSNTIQKYNRQRTTLHCFSYFPHIAEQSAEWDNFITMKSLGVFPDISAKIFFMKICLPSAKDQDIYKKISPTCDFIHAPPRTLSIMQVIVEF